MNRLSAVQEKVAELGSNARAESLADRLVCELAQIGITTYFGVPGGAIEPLFDALARQERQGNIRLIPMRSEAAAGFAADGYYRATGRLAVCTCTTGPGTSNLITATMAAHADRVPMMILSPQVALRKQGRGALQDSSDAGYDLTNMFANCTRYSSTVTHSDQMPFKLAKAIACATTPPEGPVHLSLPSDILAGRISTDALEVRELASMSAPASQPHDAQAIADLTKDLSQATTPVYYIGDDAGPAAKGLCRLARTTGAKVVSSPAGKRWIGHLDSLYMGVLGFSGHAEARAAMADADVIVAFGATFDELSTNGWTALKNVRIHAVDRHWSFTYRLPNVRPVVAETQQIIDAIAAQHHATPQSVMYGRTLPPPSLSDEDLQTHIHPSTLMRWLSRTLPADVAVHVDAGNSFSWSTRDLVRSRPDTYRVAMGLSTMCWAIGAAIGAAIGRGRRTICVSGDGAFLMSSLELTVAVEQNLPVTYVILNDSCLGMVRHGQRMGGAEPIAHAIAPVRFDQLARACGAQGFRVDNRAELEQIPREFFTDDDAGPALIDVVIDREAVPPMADRVRALANGGLR